MIFDNQTCVIASDPDGDSIALSFTGVPNGLTVTDNGGGEMLLNGDPEGTAPWIFQATASDGTASTVQTITLNCGGSGSTLTGGTLPDKTIAFGAAMGCDASGCFSNAAGTLNYSVSSAPNLTGLMVNAAGIVMIPASAAADEYVITVTGNDGSNTASCTLNLEVEANAASGPVNSTGCGVFPTADEDDPFSQVLGPYQAFTGGTLPISLSVMGLPAGVTLNNLGGGSYQLTVAPSTPASAASTYTVTAQDANGLMSVCGGNVLEIIGL